MFLQNVGVHCNVVNYDIGPLTTISSSALIITEFLQFHYQQNMQFPSESR